MRKIFSIGFLLAGWLSFGQAPPPPDGCDLFYALDSDGDGFTQFNLNDLRAYVAVDAMHDHGWDLSGYDLIIYASENDYNLQISPLSGTFYTNVESLQQQVFVDFVYNGNGPDLNAANLASARCWVLIPVPASEDADADGVPNLAEDLNGNGTLNDNDSNGDFIFNFLDPNDDGDALLTIEEDYNGNGNPADDDTNANGTPDYLENMVVLDVGENTGLDFKVYPNPSYGDVTVDFPNIENEVTLSVFDAAGRQIKTLEADAGPFTIGGLQTGVYLLRFASQSETVVKKLVIL